jgi:hypothetical protein
MVFTIYEHTKTQCLEYNTDWSLSYLQATFTAATIAGAFTSLLTSPFQLVKVQQQAAARSITAKQCVQAIVGQLGVRGLFHASGSVMAVEGVGRGIYMLLYEFFKMKLSGIDHSSSKYRVGGSSGEQVYYKDDVALQYKVVSASAAGATSWAIMYPFDSVKSRRLNDLTSTSSYDMCRKIYRLGGVQAFYRGCAFAMLRSVPVAATILPLYEFTRGQLAKALAT